MLYVLLKNGEMKLTRQLKCVIRLCYIDTVK